MTDIVKIHSVPTFDHIINNLYLGDINAANDDKCMEIIDVVLNLSNSIYDEKNGTIYHHYNVPDHRNIDLTDIFEDTYKNIAENPDKMVLVHCQNGVSRSVSIVLYYLMKIGMHLREAINYLKSKRTQYVRPNIGFFKQLISHENRLFGTNSLGVSDFATLTQ